jgi:hypothetical protein
MQDFMAIRNRLNSETKIAGHGEAPEYNQHTPQVANNGLNPFSRKEEPS